MNIKLIAGIMAVMLVFAACGSESADNSSKSENTTTTTTAPAETEAAAETTTTTAEPETETTTTTEAVTETEPVETSEPETETEAAVSDTPEETGIVTMEDNPDGLYPMEECFRRFVEDFYEQKVIDISFDENVSSYVATCEDGTKFVYREMNGGLDAYDSNIEYGLGNLVIEPLWDYVEGYDLQVTYLG
ncbi:hypothetical protein [Ruminococcus sp.]|uniref:hypothetical protein n=1 Tax=Ruminococcus sp. TaxID=41978 RepID=UPI0025E5C122|nr:hypothetical protein [Ruminococcus sp.]MBQ8965294.1 hypothetical protein [Ruminococcus sp.]